MAASKYEAYKGPQLYVKLKESPSVFGFGEDTVKKACDRGWSIQKGFQHGSYQYQKAGKLP